ncbi:MAG: heat-inducible transcriptional repressor HrcA [Polyangiaceae bacterium]
MTTSASVSLSLRARRILYAVVTEYISTGEAVGSRTLAKRYGLDLSPATIRNVLSDLEEGGYLSQPHTSAGRIPTDKSFRFFIDSMMEAHSLSTDELTSIEERYRSLGRGVDLLRNSGRILSELTGTAAVIVSPGPNARTLRQLRFIPTRPGELLAVLVLSDGGVENRFVPFEGDLREPELTRLHNLLADIIEGRSLSEIRELCARRLADERVQIDDLRRQAFELGKLATEGVGRTEVLVEGQARLLEHPELASVDRMRELVSALEDHQLLLTLLDQTVSASGASVLVGRDLGDLGGGTLSVVTAPYTDHGRVAGAIGVLGVMRMDYAKVVPVVNAAAKAMSGAFERAQYNGEPTDAPTRSRAS